MSRSVSESASSRRWRTTRIATSSSRRSTRVTCSAPARRVSLCGQAFMLAASSTISSACSRRSMTGPRSRRPCREMRNSMSCSLRRERARDASAIASRLALGLMTLAIALAASFAVAAGLSTVELSIKGHRLVAEVAMTVPDRTTGLMNRFSLQNDHGMLFVFDAPQPLAFWMKNTYIPLSIAYIDASGRIVNIEDMAPQTEETHQSHGPALYALEMKKGWFAQRSIAEGDHVDGL